MDEGTLSRYTRYRSVAFGESDEETVRTIITTVCSVPCEQDGITFDLETLRVSPIRDNQKYQGQRANLRARLGTARIAVQVDFALAMLLPQLSMRNVCLPSSVAFRYRWCGRIRELPLSPRS